MHLMTMASRFVWGSVGDILRVPSLTLLAYPLSGVGSRESIGEGAEVLVQLFLNCPHGVYITSPY